MAFQFETANERWSWHKAAEEESEVVETPPTEGGPALAQTVQAIVNKTFHFYMMAHTAHWNTAGSDFPEFHDFFGELYEDAIGAIDHLAELVLMLGAKASLSAEEVQSHGTVDQMVQDLAGCNDELVEMLKSAVESATAQGEHAVANDLADRLGMHQKWAWQLKATETGE